MTIYILFETALRMLAIAYLVSLILLLAASYIGWVAIETIESVRPPLGNANGSGDFQHRDTVADAL